MELSSEIYAIASNQVNYLALGGQEKKVDLHLVEDLADEEAFLATPELGMQFDGEVSRIQWLGKHVIGYSGDQHA